MSRRGFIEAAGTGLFVLFQAEPGAGMQHGSRTAARSEYPSDFNAYLHIDADNRVTGMVGKVEMGQGSKTALAQLLAEELDVAVESVDMVMSDTGVCPWDMGTVGSLSVKMFGPVLRKAAAEARAVLLQMAAEHFDVPSDSLRVHEGVISERTASGRRVTYGQLVQGKRIERHIANVPVKDVREYRVIGQAVARKDTLEKLTGAAKFAGDIAVPGMLHARILRPPAHGAVLKSVDTSAAEKVPGVRLVRDGDLIAVLHAERETADRALHLIKAEFVLPDAGVDSESIFDHLVKVAPEPAVVGEKGSLAAGEKAAARVPESTYQNAYVAHAPIETHSAVAVVKEGEVTVWASTQTPFPVQQQIAEVLNLEPQHVRVIAPYLGGGFGGKSVSDQAIEAARLARASGKPVKVVWDRAEEFFYDHFRPAAVVKIRSGLNNSGAMTSWDFVGYGEGDREAVQFYDIPHQRTRCVGGWMGENPPGLQPLAVGAWRAPSVNTNTFARESQIDILANAAGVDPVAFRLSHLSDKRMRTALEATAKRFGWTPALTPSGRGFGVSCAIYRGTYIVAMAEVSVNQKSGAVHVKRVVCAVDAGVIVNPEGARQQFEGGITMGLGYALSEGVRFKNGKVLDHNFDTYDIPRFSWVPKIETILIDDTGVAAQGLGEPPLVNMGSVVANAIYDACGARVFELPMTPARVLAALARRSP